MSTPQPPRPPSQRELEPQLAPGRRALLLAAVVAGLLLLSIQLWLLTVALDLFLGGRGDEVWALAGVSGLIFLGGLVTVRVLDRRAPRP